MSDEVEGVKPLAVDGLTTVEEVRRRENSRWLAEVRAYVELYTKSHGPVKLSILNRRWNVPLKQAMGISLKEFIFANRAVFQTDLNDKGAITVTIIKDTPLAVQVRTLLEDGELTHAQLLAALKGSGYTLAELLATTMDLAEREVIRVKSGVYTLLVR